MKRTHDVVDLSSRILVWASGGLLLVSAIYITVETLMRTIFSISAGTANEVSTYAFAICSTWALSYTLIHKGHIRMDTLYKYMPAAVRSVADLVSLISLIIAAIALTWYGWDVLSLSIARGSISNTSLGIPMWIPQGAWLFGIVVFGVVSAYLLLRCLPAFFRGEHAEVSKLAGLPSAEEEARDDLEWLEETGPVNKGTKS